MSSSNPTNGNAAAISDSQQQHKDATIFADHPDLKPQYISPALIIVMGVSGCGKSTIGQKIADLFRIQFVDGDDLHPKSNIEKMSRGEPLNDQDREPWLNLIRQEAAKKTTKEALQQFYHSKNLKDPQQPRAGIVIACSALKKTYRDMLRGSTNEAEHRELDKSHDNVETYFVYLKGSRELLMGRMQARKGHFFGAKMLDSQLQTLEEPSENEAKTEGVIEVDISKTEDEVAQDAVQEIQKLVGLRILENYHVYEG